jgi:proline racemase
MTVRHVDTIDTHTLGEPTRIVLSGFPRLRGRTLADRSADLLRRHDELRRSLMLEPRGHAVMFGAVVVPPADPKADLGLVFMDGGGAVQMCVHGTIGAVTALVETGRLRPPRDGVLAVDTPAATVRVRIHRTGKRVSAVDLEGVPSRSVATGLAARAAGKRVEYDLAYGGNLIALVRAADLGLELEPHAFKALVEAGMEVKTHAQRAWFSTSGRLGPWPEVVSSLIWSSMGPRRYRDLVVFRDHSVDRSPCGTCFSALMARLHSGGELQLGKWIECENLLRLAFRGRLFERAGELVPELSGWAFITGEHRFHIDDRDPLAHGFRLG